MILKGKKVEYTLGKEIGKGGEATVYALTSHAGLVAKIYHEKFRTTSKEKKIIAVSSIKPVNTAISAKSSIAWPLDILYDGNRFMGFVMERLQDSVSLNEVYTMDGPYAHVSHKIRIIIAQNLCAAINEIHEIQQVFGDFNPNNISVHMDKGLVTLLDVDSFHVNISGRLYRCEVGRPEFCAPELQKKLTNGVNLATVALPTYTIQTDLFALAIHIFMLLMNGVHPYVARSLNPEDSSSNPGQLHNIREGRCPFFIPEKGLAPPVFAPPISAIPYKIREYMVRSFVRGNDNPFERPNALEWYNALGSYRKDLAECDQYENHYYWNQLKSCPWCELESQLASIGYPIKSVKKLPRRKKMPQRDPKESIQPYVAVQQEGRYSIPIHASVNPPQASPEQVKAPVAGNMQTVANGGAKNLPSLSPLPGRGKLYKKLFDFFREYILAGCLLLLKSYMWSMMWIIIYIGAFLVGAGIYRSKAIVWFLEGVPSEVHWAFWILMGILSSIIFIKYFDERIGVAEILHPLVMIIIIVAISWGVMSGLFQ